jgi:hypothetical protein
MARGFESKDVEFQQAEAANQPTLRRTLSPEERDAQTRRQTLELTLTRARSELAAARSDRHRHMLERAVADLEERLEAHR